MFLHDEYPECYHCNEKDKKISEIKSWTEAVLDQLFGLEEFDPEELELYLEELTYCLDMKIPRNSLAVKRKEKITDISPIVDSWKNLNNNYLKNLSLGN